MDQITGGGYLANSIRPIRLGLGYLVNSIRSIRLGLGYLVNSFAQNEFNLVNYFYGKGGRVEAGG